MSEGPKWWPAKDAHKVIARAKFLSAQGAKPTSPEARYLLAVGRAILAQRELELSAGDAARLRMFLAILDEGRAA
jgi:hypothetical protein